MADSPLPPARSRIPRLTGRRMLLIALMGALTVALLVTLGGGRSTLDAFRTVRWQPVLMAIAIHYAGFALRGHRWQLLLARMGHHLRYLIVLALLLAGWFASALLPARAGEVVRIVALRGGVDDSPPVPVADSLGSIVLERVLDILAIVILGAVFAWFTLRGSLPPWVVAVYATAIVLLVLLVVALLVAPAMMASLQHLWDNRWWQAALRFADRFVAALRSLSREPATALIAIVESLAIWMCDALLLWLALIALGEPIAFGPVAFVAFTVDIVAALPLTPGGVGQVEVASAALLALIGVPAPAAAAAVLIVRGISYWSFLIVSGAVAFWAGFSALLSPAASYENEAS